MASTVASYATIVIALGVAYLLMRTPKPPGKDVGASSEADDCDAAAHKKAKKKTLKKKATPAPHCDRTATPPPPSAERRAATTTAQPAVPPAAAPAAAAAAAAATFLDESEETFRAGDRVEALWQTKVWFPATVVSVKPLGGGAVSYAVAYADGARESRLPRDRLRKADATAAAADARVASAARAQKAPSPPMAAPSPPIARPEASDLPDLGACVAYRKQGAAAPHVTTQPRKATAATAHEDHEDDDDDGDSDGDSDAGGDSDLDSDSGFAVVQSEADWKRAAVKPKRPKVARQVKPPKPDASEKATAEKNRKKKEVAKAKKLALREHMRKTL